jgi:hypothetical protein
MALLAGGKHLIGIPPPPVELREDLDLVESFVACGLDP